MIIIGIMIFAFTCWAVFSKNINDGIVTKHLLSFSAILAFLVIVDPHNHKAAITSFGLLLAAIVYSYLWPTPHGPLFGDRRRKQRQ